MIILNPIEVKCGIYSVTVGPMGSGASYETDGIDDEVQLQQAIEYIESLAKSDFIKASNKKDG